jgi:glutathione S-transferase
MLKLNPRAKVPVYTDDDVTLIESSAIIHYLEQTYSGKSLLLHHFWLAICY